MDSFKDYLFHSLDVINRHSPNGKKTRINVNMQKAASAWKSVQSHTTAKLLQFLYFFLSTANICSETRELQFVFYFQVLTTGLVHNLKENIVFNGVPTCYVSKNNTYVTDQCVPLNAFRGVWKIERALI